MRDEATNFVCMTMSQLLHVLVEFWLQWMRLGQYNTSNVI
jgi:hypothetical protein